MFIRFVTAGEKNELYKIRTIFENGCKGLYPSEINDFLSLENLWLGIYLIGEQKIKYYDETLCSISILGGFYNEPIDDSIEYWTQRTLRWLLKQEGYFVSQGINEYRRNKKIMAR